MLLLDEGFGGSEGSVAGPQDVLRSLDLGLGSFLFRAAVGNPLLEESTGVV